MISTTAPSPESYAEAQNQALWADVQNTGRGQGAGRLGWCQGSLSTTRMRAGPPNRLLIGEFDWRHAEFAQIGEISIFIFIFPQL